MASVATHRASPEAPGVADVELPLHAAGPPIPAPDRPDALAGLSVVIACRDDAATAARARAEAGRSTTGTGLGLAIVNATARSHGGSAHAANRNGGGADVWIAISGEPQAGQDHHVRQGGGGQG